MDWIVGLLLLLSGVVIGAFTARHVILRQSLQQSPETIEANVKGLLFAQAKAHMEQSRQVIDQIRRECDQLTEQLDGYEHVLAEDQVEDAPKLNFFGDQASTYLRNQQTAPIREKKSPEYQPRDYSGDQSGLFSGSKNQQTVDDE